MKIKRHPWWGPNSAKGFKEPKKREVVKDEKKPGKHPGVWVGVKKC